MAIDAEFLKSIGLDSDEIMQKIHERSVADETGLINKRDELLGKVTTYKDQLSKFDGVDVDQYKTAIEKLRGYDEKNLMDKGEFDKLLDLSKAEWSGKLDKSEGRSESLMKQLKELIEDKSVLSAVGDKGDGDLILGAIKQHKLIETVDSEDGIVLKIKSMDGTKELDNISQLIDEMSKSEKFARLFNSSGLSGGGARPSGSGNSDDDKVFGSARMAAARNK